MGWFWESSKPNDSTTALDPQLRQFLDVQSRSAGNIESPSNPSRPPSDAASSTYRAQLGWKDASDPNATSRTASPPSEESVAPSNPSLFQDGRYAELWKNYRSQDEIEDAVRSEQERMSDVVAAFKARQAAVGRAAVENCVMEQMAERDCWQNGSWSDRLTMCRGPNRNFLRCYTMQSRFLKALGYLSQMRTEEEDEKIQMHADKLYHRMLQREADNAQAELDGVDPSPMPPLMNPEEIQQALGDDSAWAKSRRRAAELGVVGKLSEFPARKQKVIREKVEKLTGDERELELQLLAAESRATLELRDQLAERFEAERKERADRAQRGKSTFGDRLKHLSGWK